LALGARTFIHSGRRGRSATGSDLSIGTSLGIVVPEAPLEKTDHGSYPVGEGWFVLNLRDAQWFDSKELGLYAPFEGETARFDQLGINIGILRPGEPSCMYHAEDAQEDFLVLSGECLLVVEGQERRLEQWDFVHCPAMTEHVFVGAGDGPCVLLGTGARRKGRDLVYPVNEVALGHGAGVTVETGNPAEAYSRFPDSVPIPCPDELPDL
jgi:uncharacterized cupin superfamily protein